jgi:hypothetical protein
MTLATKPSAKSPLGVSAASTPETVDLEEVALGFAAEISRMSLWRRLRVLTKIDRSVTRAGDPSAQSRALVAAFQFFVSDTAVRKRR